MAYHLIPFVAGAVVGGLAAYLFRDERLRKDLRESADSLSRKAQETASEVSGKVATGVRQVRKSMAGQGRADESATDTAEPEVKTKTRKPRAAVRSTAARRSSTRTAAPKRGPKAAAPTKPENPEDL
jgi:gas vesicle protein